MIYQLTGILNTHTHTQSFDDLPKKIAKAAQSMQNLKTNNTCTYGQTTF